ncbi:LicD family protein [Brevibacillus nitrificans]|uniref:LicD family protein n=1 Tax=Brevibacillus nitrificans TaxID=651560 RepID=A0A3M8DRL9_9BACL|nr:LicD family protein [Brevibacillus nitrificans]RNB90105.1 LicD family protein [Brevibacillus nitrificans]
MKPGVDYLKLNDDQLKQLQEEMLPLLIEIDRICRKHNITYFLSDGTLLGAVRHKGFIPWDDDMDVQMLRKDYDRFIEVCETELDTSKFFLQHQQNDEHYNWVYGKLRVKNTTYVRAGQEHIKQKTGICIDIFPLDPISENKYKQRIALYMCNLCRKILWAQVGKKAANTAAGRALFRVLSLIPRKLTILVFELFAKSEYKKNTAFLANHNLVRKILKSEWYSETITVEFEGHNFSAPKRYDDILSSLYGKYLEPPDVNNRHGNAYASQIKFTNGIELKL